MGSVVRAANHRDVRVLPVLHDELTDLKARAGDTRAGVLVFPTAEGRRFGASNLRRRVLARAIERANKRLSEAASSPLPERLTPRSLRRTFASLLYALGESPPDVMAEMGHTHLALALAIYAQAMRYDHGERDRLRALVEGASRAPVGTRSGPTSPLARSTRNAGTPH
jgi:integrase